jgi:acetyl esterase/lipase
MPKNQWGSYGIFGQNGRNSTFSKTMKYLITLAFICGSLNSNLFAADRTTIRLWEKGAPGTPATKPADEPAVYLTRPQSHPTKTAVIILPGGGYGHLAIDYEGHDVAAWFNSFGVTAFVLKYRMHATGHMHPVPMMDGQRAIRTVRARAAEWEIDPKQIGVLGFSAGGHLASTLGTHFDKGNDQAKDEIDRVSSRPDFLVLCYPVISLESPSTHRGSRANLLGESPDPKLVHSLSNETQVTKDTPQTFIFQTSDDKAVPAENSVAFYLALHKAGVPAEMHIFQSGRHGLGLAKDTPGARLWPELCHEWLNARGLLKPAETSNK